MCPVMAQRLDVLYAIFFGAVSSERRTTCKRDVESRHAFFARRESKVWCASCQALPLHCFVPKGGASAPQTCSKGKTVWPCGRRRWLKEPFRKGLGSNPTAAISHPFQFAIALVICSAVRFIDEGVKRWHRSICAPHRTVPMME